jgi:3-methyl-2-oxobutanoate hydroxymethyltransferase
MIQVGDTLAYMVLGYDDTLPATVDGMIYHTAAVARTKPAALIVGDMSWLSYYVSVEEAVRSAGRFLPEGRAECVKREGGRRIRCKIMHA